MLWTIDSPLLDEHLGILNDELSYPKTHRIERKKDNVVHARSKIGIRLFFSRLDNEPTGKS